MMRLVTLWSWDQSLVIAFWEEWRRVWVEDFVEILRFIEGFLGILKGFKEF